MTDSNSVASKLLVSVEKSDRRLKKCLEKLLPVCVCILENGRDVDSTLRPLNSPNPSKNEIADPKNAENKRFPVEIRHLGKWRISSDSACIGP
jgi:hypothetical protein